MEIYKLLVSLAFLLTLSPLGDSLLCYSCRDKKSNDMCSRETDVIDCNNQSSYDYYDTCQTTVRKSKEGRVLITKRCAVGPCALENNQDAALGLACDRVGDNWQCQQCCDEDKCNVGGAPERRISMVTVVWFCLLVILATK